MRAKLAVAACSALLLVACQPKRPPPPRPAPIAPAVARGAPLGTLAYFNTAASLDLLVIRASELVRSRSAGAGVDELARMLASGHTATSAQLAFAGRRLNLLPSTSLLLEHQAMLDTLSASSDIGPAYLRLMRHVHEATASLHGNFAVRGESPTLRPVAAFAIQIERAHTERLGQR